MNSSERSEDDERAAPGAANSGDLPLSPVQIAELDHEGLDQLFFDIGAAAELLAIVVKGGAEMHAEVRDACDPGALERARAALREGGATGVQLRYVHEGTEWWDTLLQTERGARLVRVERPKEARAQ